MTGFTLAEFVVTCCLLIESTIEVTGVDGVLENNLTLRGNGNGVVEAERLIISELSSS
jgi:hypothetical protein